jgi:cardiolipin synthase
MENASWEVEKIFFKGDDYYAHLLEGIRTARSSIYLEVYIFAKSTIGDRFAQALNEARDRGVNIKLLLDGFGSPSFVDAYEEQLRGHRIEVHFYRAVPWDMHTHSRESLNPLRRMLNRFYRLNHGTHRKYCLIDKKRLWIGSMNICDEHSEEVMGALAWRDMGVYVEGPEVNIAKKAFLKSFESGRELKKADLGENNLIVLNQTRALKKRHRSAQLRRLRTSTHRIWIETPYFVPITRMLLMLLKKQRDGLDVRVIVPKRNDVWITKWISYTYLFQLARKGVKVYEYEPRFLHSKVFVIDNWICVGSTNLNHRSFLHDLEMDVVLTHPRIKDLVVRRLEEDMSLSDPLNQDIWAAFPWWKRFLSRLLSIFSYWS